MTKMAFLGVISLTLLVWGNGHFGWLHRIEEWRYGRKVDETQDWQAFTSVFQDEK